MTIQFNAVDGSGGQCEFPLALIFIEGILLGKCRYDSQMIVMPGEGVVLAVLISLIFTHDLKGVREGTILSVLFTGRWVDWLQQHDFFLGRFLTSES